MANRKKKTIPPKKSDADTEDYSRWDLVRTITALNDWLESGAGKGPEIDEALDNFERVHGSHLTGTLRDAMRGWHSALLAAQSIGFVVENLARALPDGVKK